MPPKPFTKPKIGAIGTINRDTIYQPDGGVVESWGGLLYNLKYLCESAVAKIIPIINIGRDSFRPIMKIMGGFENIDLSNIKKVRERNNHCFLHYHNQSHKCEILKGSVPPLTYSRVKPILNCDLILINFISGPDIKLAALERLRREYHGIIYMDIHSLTLGRKKVAGGYRRLLRRPRYWRRYAACADILQLNETEFELLSGNNFSRQNIVRFVTRQLRNLKCLIVTCGDQGCMIIYRKNENIHSRSIPPVKIPRVHDTTGCGDIFGAGFIIEYLKSGRVIKAAQYGNRLAASRCGKKSEMF